MSDAAAPTLAEEDVPLRPLTSIQQSVIALASVAMGAGMTINFVVVAPLARQAGLTEIQVASILTLSTIIYTVSIPYWGRLADRFGRKRVMVFSLLAMASTNMAFLFGLKAALAGVVTGLSTLFLLAFLRIWFGLLSPGLQPASMAAMTDATTPRNRAAGLGLLGAAMSLGSILGPAGAAILAPFGALAPLWGSIIFCALCAGIVAFSLPKSVGGHRTKRPKPLRIRDPRILPHMAFLFAYFAAVGMVQQTLGWLIEDRYGLSKADSVQSTGMAFAALAAGMIMVQFGVVQTMNPNPRRILPLGLGMIAIGYVGAAMSQPFWLMIVFFLLIGSGAAFAVPAANALGSLSVSRPEQAAAAGLLSSAPPGGFIVGPLLGAALYMTDPHLPLLISAAAMLALGVYATVVTAKRENAGTHS